MISNREIRLKGSASLRGNYLAAIGNLIIISVLSAIIQTMFSPDRNFQGMNDMQFFSGGETLLSIVLALITAFITSLLTMGLHWGFLDIQESERMTVGHLFLPFKQQAMKAVAFVFRRDLLIMLWSLLLIIPGIIKAYAWAVADYIYYDEPNLPNQDILDKSEQLMQGNKWKLFRLEFYYGFLYFVPILIWLAGTVFLINPSTNEAEGLGLLFVWMFVGFILVGMAMLLIGLFVEPRRHSARAAFYTSL